MVKEDQTPTMIMTRESFENAVVLNSALGGSTNAPIHINAIARHVVWNSGLRTGRRLVLIYLYW